MTSPRRKSGHFAMNKRSTTRKNKKPVMGGNRTPIVVGTQSMPGNGNGTASPAGPLPTVDVRRCQKPRRPSNTCNFSFRDAASAGKPVVNSETRGTMSAMTSAMSKATLQTIPSAAIGRGTRKASSLRARGDNIDADDERRRDRQHQLPSKSRARSRRRAPLALQATMPRLFLSGSMGRRLPISSIRATGRGRRPSRNTASPFAASATMPNRWSLITRSRVESSVEGEFGRQFDWREDILFTAFGRIERRGQPGHGGRGCAA